MEKKQLRLLMIGAHPDDCEIQTGGIAIKFRALGHSVKFVAVTNGDTGHYELSGAKLARIRRQEMADACAVAGIEYEVLDIHSNQLEADIPTRERIICLIREYKPDMIFTHRLNDYHPDHRRTAMLVQDSSYAIRVPSVCPFTPCLRYSPVILYMHDNFKKPYPFEPSVVVDIDDVIDTKIKMISCHKSQMFEWGPWMDGNLDEVPENEDERMKWFTEKQKARAAKVADKYRNLLIKRYGQERGSKIKFAEAFEVSEYARQLREEEIPEFFPF